jgi:hypothetical protein
MCAQTHSRQNWLPYCWTSYIYIYIYECWYVFAQALRDTRKQTHGTGSSCTGAAPAASSLCSFWRLCFLSFVDTLLAACTSGVRAFLLISAQFACGRTFACVDKKRDAGLAICPHSQIYAAHSRLVRMHMACHELHDSKFLS